MTILQEYVTIRTLSLGTRAHLSRSMGGWWSPPKRRSGSRTIPGRTGIAARPVVNGPIQFLHPVWVDGRYDPNGTARPNPRDGWRINMDLLESACEPESAAPWTFQAVHTLADGATRTAQIQVLDLLVPSRPSGYAGEVTIEVLIPSGTFTYAAAV